MKVHTSLLSTLKTCLFMMIVACSLTATVSEARVSIGVGVYGGGPSTVYVPGHWYHGYWVPGHYVDNYGYYGAPGPGYVWVDSYGGGYWGRGGGRWGHGGGHWHGGHGGGHHH